MSALLATRTSNVVASNVRGANGRHKHFLHGFRGCAPAIYQAASNAGLLMNAEPMVAEMLKKERQSRGSQVCGIEPCKPARKFRPSARPRTWRRLFGIDKLRYRKIIKLPKGAQITPG